MSYTEKESIEVMESFDPMSMGDSTNFVLNTSGLDELAGLSQGEIFRISTDMEAGSEEDIQTMEETIEEEYVQDELGAHEVEIETVEGESAAVIEETVPIETAKIVKTSVPPLRPLTIAPKPAKTIPIQVKGAGTQLLLLQGSSVGQPIKILSTSGQELNLANVSMAKPISIKPAVKQSTSNISILQPKQVLMKKVITQSPKANTTKTIENKSGHVLVMQKSDNPQVKLIQSSSVLSGTTKTMTLSQAHQMGYLTGAKVAAGSTKQTFVVNKPQGKSIKLVPQKSPTKILPAPQGGTSVKLPQRIFLKPSNTSPIVGTSQLIQVASGTQTLGSPGQLHQINIPGKGVQFIKFIQSPQADTSATTVSGITTLKTQSSPISTTKLIPVSSITSPVKSTTGVVSISDIKKLTKPNLIAPKLTKVGNSLGPGTSQLLVVPTSYVSTATTAKVAIPSRPKPVVPIPESPLHQEIAMLESNGMRPRKPCNCTKSQCLKLYCDCFANGEFCYMCNCVNCFNNLENEEHRQRAIKNCLERNPNAFRPKIGKAKDTTGDTPVRKHTKGCNCKRSGCLKNYCECYEAKIACSSNCKCVGCRNVEDSTDKKSSKSNSMDSGNTSQQLPSYSFGSESILQVRPKKLSNTKQAFNYITNPVIEASTTCLLALCNNEDIDEDEELCTKKIIEEFGRCLEDIIQCSLKTANIKTET